GHPPVCSTRLLLGFAMLASLAACNRGHSPSPCAPLASASEARVTDYTSGQKREYVIKDRYRLRDLVAFVNGRREGFSYRKALPAASSTATLYEGSKSLVTLGAGPNF